MSDKTAVKCPVTADTAFEASLVSKGHLQLDLTVRSVEPFDAKAEPAEPAKTQWELSRGLARAGWTPTEITKNNMKMMELREMRVDVMDKLHKMHSQLVTFVLCSDFEIPPYRMYHSVRFACQDNTDSADLCPYCTEIKPPSEIKTAVAPQES
ncbi:hypothetical protein DPSP01_008325 [Paraphaeosphaeria sporulosa]|uniref:Uncharacterized protein n=1 Tax=Paraphaeosphaeria sporulosa TaxID=1460663 RepID=A0A177CMB5_9PLEO|nr:uncharacterized protein CC84DRAFT_1256955 [Paraphaeosphaeria sporulosa]OAG08018.1 hypothetical protein CC84DRAFT_1256955 [Paraphaeosphaeria sporulosa]